MKNIFLALMIGVFFLPQLSFGAIDPQLMAFNQQEDAKAHEFFTGQAQERAEFIKTHQELIAKLDAKGQEIMRQKNGDKSLHPPAEPLTSDESSTWSAFTSKQQADKSVFMAQLNQDRQQFLSSHPGTN